MCVFMMTLFFVAAAKHQTACECVVWWCSHFRALISRVRRNVVGQHRSQSANSVFAVRSHPTQVVVSSPRWRLNLQKCVLHPGETDEDSHFDPACCCVSLTQRSAMKRARIPRVGLPAPLMREFRIREVLICNARRLRECSQPLVHTCWTRWRISTTSRVRSVFTFPEFQRTTCRPRTQVRRLHKCIGRRQARSANFATRGWLNDDLSHTRKVSKPCEQWCSEGLGGTLILSRQRIY